MYGGCAMRMRILSITIGALFAAIPFTAADAAPSAKDLCVIGVGLCDHGNRNNNRNTSSNSGGDNGGNEGCGGGGESSRKGSNRKGKGNNGDSGSGS